MDRIRDKKAFRQSNTTTYRERAPTSPEIASRGMTNMAIDFSRQQAVVPSRFGSTHRETPGRTMNRSGRPMALDVMVGGSPEASGMPKAGPRKNQGSVKGK